MAIFDNKSRYVQNAQVVQRKNAQGENVLALSPASRPEQVEIGRHKRKDSQRLDHLANYYLKDPSAYWRICELNDVMIPDALAERAIIRIPSTGR